MKPTVSIITVNYNQTAVTAELLASIEKLNFHDLEVIVVDNGSRENPATKLRKRFPKVKWLLSPDNLGFAGGNNLGIRAAQGEYLFFVNNDTELVEGCMEQLLAVFEKTPDVGVVSPKICYFYDKNGKKVVQNRIIQYAGMTPVHPLTARNETIGKGQMDHGQFSLAQATAYAHGAAMMVSRKTIKAAGFMPEEFFLYYEELDWCERIRSAGFSVWVEPNAMIWHKESQSVKQLGAKKTYYLHRNRLLFMRRNRNVAQLGLFAVFFLLATLPKNTLIFLIKGEFDQLSAFFSAICWHFSRPKLFSKNRESTPKIGAMLPIY